MVSKKIMACCAADRRAVREEMPLEADERGGGGSNCRVGGVIRYMSLMQVIACQCETQRAN